MDSVRRTLYADSSLLVARSRSAGAVPGAMAYALRIVCLFVACSVMPMCVNAAIATSVSITSSVNTVASGENFQLTLSVNASTAGGVPTGTITLIRWHEAAGAFQHLFGCKQHDGPGATHNDVADGGSVYLLVFPTA
jgi:hypothetical protein